MTNFIAILQAKFDKLYCSFMCKRTSDGGNAIHSVSLPIILIKIKVHQMLPYSYISSLSVSVL